jgi:ribosomal-protein-alanine N-acetyltransferase
MLPRLLTVRLALRAAVDDDLDSLWRLWTDPAVRRFLWDDEIVTRDRAAEVLAHAHALEAVGLGLWVIERRGEPELLGCAGLRPTEVVGGIEPLIALAPAAWRQGYAAEALGAVHDYAFWRLGLDELVAWVDVPNAPSHRLVERLGFSASGELDGPRYRMRHYVLSRSEYVRRAESPARG